MTRATVRGVVVGLISGVSLLFGVAGTAHAHGTWSPPAEPRSPVVHPHSGPFSVLHKGGPFSVLHQTG
jgi:hypothetical protein